jgi:DNA invertase Pin-like site-specific DNA recombinase
MMTPAKVSRIVAYVRVSRVGTRDVDSDSYQTESIQLEACQRWADERKIELVSGPQFVDRDQSGSKDDRPGLAAALAEVRDGRADGIVVATLDRFSRQSTIDALKRVQEVQDAGGIVASVGGEVPVDPTSDTGEFILTLFAAIARMEWRRYAARWEVAKTRAVERGAKISRAPVGYRRVEGGSLKPDPVEAPVIAEAYRLAATENLRASVDYLQAAKLTNPHGTRYNKAGSERRWTGSTVRRLLASRVYLGEIAYGDGLVNSEAHEPIVDLATWTSAQGHPPGTRGPRASYPLSGGAALCGTCGCHLTGRKGGTGKNYRRMYTCLERRHGEPCERRASVSADPLEQYVQAALLQHVATERPDALVTLEAGRGDSSDVEAAELALRSAELRRDEDLANLELPPDQLTARLAAHERAIATAQERYEQALADAQPPLEWPLVDEVATATPDELPALLGRCGLVVRVAPGRGNLEHRVTLESDDAGTVAA